jgi:6-phosphogluconolactonase
MGLNWHVAAAAGDWLGHALQRVARAERAALAARGEFHIVLAGGSTPRALYAALAGAPHDWSRWQVWFGDERCLPPDDPARNSVMARQALLARVAIPAGAIHAIPAELGAETAAPQYARELAGVDRFDLVLLGLGEDGHTASLFPGRDWGERADAPAALAVLDAPKPPPARVSLSAWRLARARNVLFLVAGRDKRDAVARWQRGERLPAAAISAPDSAWGGDIEVLLDTDACPTGATT